MRQTARAYGQTVLWFELDEAHENPHDPYDEGGRFWKSPRTINVYQASIDEGEQQFLRTGAYRVATLHLIIEGDELRRRGISQPIERGAHDQDRIIYDGRLFSVDDLEPRGRIGNTLMTVSVQCTEVMEDEQQMDDLTWYPAAVGYDGDYNTGGYG